MDPNQNQYPVDYLNQIAPQPQKRGLSNKRFFILIGGGLLFALIIGMFALSSGGNSGPTSEMQTLAARMITLQSISDKAQINIKSGTLRGTNSDLTIFLTNANQGIAAPLLASGVDVKKLDTTVVAAEAHADLSSKLEDARLNAVFDRTYAREMGYQLDTVTALMKDIYAKSSSKSLKDFLSSTNQNLQTITNQLQSFNAANG